MPAQPYNAVADRPTDDASLPQGIPGGIPNGTRYVVDHLSAPRPFTPAIDEAKAGR